MSEPTTYAAPTRGSSTTDRIITVVLMIGLGLLVPIASFLGLLFSMASDGCMGGTSCNADQIGLGVGVAALSPIVVFVVALVIVGKRFARRRPTWWVPLAALAVGACLWMLGGVIAASGAG